MKCKVVQDLDEAARLLRDHDCGIVLSVGQDSQVLCCNDEVFAKARKIIGGGYRDEHEGYPMLTCQKQPNIFKRLSEDHKREIPRN